MDIRTRTTLPLLAALCAAAIAALSLLRLAAPVFAAWYAGLPPSLLDRVVDPFVAAVIGLLVGVVGVVVSLALFARARGREISGATGVVAVAVTVVALVLAPGNAIPVAGYTFALTAMGIVIVGTVLLAIRRPLVGIPVAAALVAVGVYATIRLGGEPLLPDVLASLIDEIPQIAVTGAYLVLAAGIVLSAIGDGRGRGAVARWVLAHRVAITVVAASCAAPYAFVRATWLTPWPLFGPGAEVLASTPDVMVIGLSLGFGMLMAGLLTLGLVLPFGERFPRWFAGIGGRAVPVGLPVISAMIVAVLFIAGGAEFLTSVMEGRFAPVGAAAQIEFVVVFPFWLWGPALGLAAWGYAMNRADRATAESDAAERGPVAAPTADAALRSRRLYELELHESREA
ncbi:MULTISPECIES: hypothetical protein [unclassified Microbacterium]|uniref:hypothetical protein n=1 Tax=unclassified Microbacterium TaxID=2609290 RepID=UPI0012FC0FA5|nr:hypothetical protein [Microbacterium sp. MAH-37]MVQ43729.1 hypothetical protein [Microbacterium sp. MAH-37]